RPGLVFGGGQVHAAGNAAGAGNTWRSPVSLSNAYTPFGGGSVSGLSDYDQGPFVPQLKSDYSIGCVTLPPNWPNGLQVKVRAYYCLKPGETSGTAPANAVVLVQSLVGRSSAPTSISQAVGEGWDLSAEGS